MLQRFKNYIQQQHLLPHGQQVLLAVSGGRDSVCMAHLFHRARIPFAIAHCNFHLRPLDCDRDEAFVRQLADSYGVPCHVASFDTRSVAAATGESIEEAARRLRYEYFSQLLTLNSKLLTVLATAHHRDDSVETLFLNLFRGTGIAGLHGIRPQTVIYGMNVIRPMLCFSRDDINDYVEKQRLAFVEDVTNQTLDARRNRIRNELLPHLREFYPSIDETIASNIRHFAEAEQVYDNYISLMRERLIQTLPRRVPTMPVAVKGIKLDEIPHPQTTILFELLRPYGANEDNVRRLLSSQIATGSNIMTPTHDLLFNRGWIVICDRVEAVEPVLSEVEGHFSNGKPGISVDADSLAYPLSLRPWKEGDQMCPLGFGHSRKVKQVLKDMKLSRYDKRYVWLLVDALDRIVWVVGLVQDNRFRVTNRTVRVHHICLESR